MCCGNKFCCSETINVFAMDSKTFLLPETYVSQFSHPGKRKRNIVSATMFPSLAKPLITGVFVVDAKRELKQPRRRRQQKPHKFARFARALFIFWDFVDVLVLSTTWNDLFWRCLDNASVWWQLFNFVFLCPKWWFQFNSRVVRTHFSSIMSLNNWKWLQKRKVTFSDDVLAFVDVVFPSSSLEAP